MQIMSLQREKLNWEPFIFLIQRILQDGIQIKGYSMGQKQELFPFHGSLIHLSSIFII